MAVKKRRKKRITKKRRVKKRVARRAKPRKRVVKKAKRAKVQKPKEEILGIVTHYFPKVRAGVIKLKKPLAVGDAIKIKGHTTDFTQTIESMQINHVPITQAKKGDEIGLLVNSRIRHNDKVYKA